ncbi:MAG: biotin/lipoyl-binding protein, partial [Candidatus Aminicenantes bacterium]|nr:biotin/lipoyl-binding protein [Candidatus Aminicenantes bacterium]
MKKNTKRLFIFWVVILIIGLIIVLNLSSQREKSIKVTAEKVKRHDLTAVISASGEIKPKKNVNISAHVPGRIVKIGVKEGQEVKAGDFLLKLDSTQYEANADRDRAMIQSYRSELIKAEATLKKSQSDYDRQKKLYDNQLVSNDQLEQAKAQLDIAQATYRSFTYQIDQGQASLKSTLDNLGKT